jgi:molecular chaperone HscC
MMTDPIVGIDLGTTNSLCAVFRDGQPELIPNAHGEFLTPSVIGLMENNQLLVGASARELRVTQPDRCASCFKRWMGTDRKTQLGKRSFSAVELSSLVLRSLKDDAEAFLQTSVSQAVITVPAYFNDNQRKATKVAGEMAGFKVRRIINEPTAAALTYGFHDREAEKHLIVIDLGGGTFDVTLMEIFEGTLEIIATAGECMLGGEDFTDRLVSAAFNVEGIQLEAAELKQPLRTARLRQECETAKRLLATSDVATIRVPNVAGGFDENGKKFRVTDEQFAKICKPLMERISKPVYKVLRDGELSPEDIHDIILVGGATRMRVVNQYVEEMFARKPLVKYDPDVVVALGAAVQSALINDDRAVDDMVMTDVCPFTLGVEVAKQFGSRVSSGYFQPIIHRNTTIPCSKEEVFETMSANQQEVKLRIFQGDARRVSDNLELGELQVKGIPPGPAGQPVIVRFTYDLNGLIEVEAKVSETGKSVSIVLTQHAASISPEELKAAVKKMQELKFYPRDDLSNQRLVLFCERMVGEIGVHQREQLEQAIDMFEHAMSAGDRTIFDQARNGLLMMLSALGIQYDEETHEREE